jgi:hypothetical protein
MASITRRKPGNTPCRRRKGRRAHPAALLLHSLCRLLERARLRRRVLYRVESGYKVSLPPIGSTVTTLPNGALTENIKGTTYFAFGGAYYRPFYSGSSVIYEVVAKPA